MAQIKDKRTAVETAWKHIEDVYGVGALFLQKCDGTYIKICNANPQQFISVQEGFHTKDYTHIESWLLDIRDNEIEAIVSIRTSIIGLDNEPNNLKRRRMPFDEQPNKRIKLYG